MPVAAQWRHRGGMRSGEVAWALINILSLNHLGLVDRNPQDRAAGLKELLAPFADLSDVVTERRIRGIQGISSRPIVRRIRQENGFNAARGIEVAVTFDERAFEGTGIMLIGAVLDRFFAEYAAINTFTQTVMEFAAARRGEALTAFRPEDCYELPEEARSRAASFRLLRRDARTGAVFGRKAENRSEHGSERRRREARPEYTPRFLGQQYRGGRMGRGRSAYGQDALSGFLRPAGGLAAHATIEAFTWSNQHDASFARFTDIFANRFQQLFFRAWADARPIAHWDRPASDHFLRLCRRDGWRGDRRAPQSQFRARHRQGAVRRTGGRAGQERDAASTC